MAKRKLPEQMPGWTPEHELRRREQRVADNPVLLEITKLAASDKSLKFVRELAEYFTSTEVVLILRAAKNSKLI